MWPPMRWFLFLSAPLIVAILSVRTAQGEALQTQGLDNHQAVAIYQEALVHYKGVGGRQDFLKAADGFRLAAGAGLKEAQFALGSLYENGHIDLDHQTQRKNEAAAIPWYERAAAQGHLKAQYNLALLLLKKKGAHQNVVQGISWLRRSAQGGCPKAQYKLAVALYEGIGAPVNKDEAIHWFHQAARSGLPEAGEALEAIHLAQSAHHSVPPGAH